MDEYEPVSDYSSDDRLWAMVCHLGTFVTIIPFANIVLPLLIWMVKRDTSPLTADQGLEVVNFQITVQLFYVLAVICFFTVVLIPVTVFIVFVVPIWQVVLSIIGAIKAFDGRPYRYPLTLRLI